MVFREDEFYKMMKGRIKQDDSEVNDKICHSLYPKATKRQSFTYSIRYSVFSVREPLIPVSSIRGETSEETKAKMTSLLVQRKQWCGKGVGRRLGDVKVLMQALRNCDKQNVRNK